MGNIEDAVGGLLTHKALASLGILFQGTLLAEVVLAACDHCILAFLPRPPADVAGKGQIIVALAAAALLLF